MISLDNNPPETRIGSLPLGHFIPAWSESPEGYRLYHLHGETVTHVGSYLTQGEATSAAAHFAAIYPTPSEPTYDQIKIRALLRRNILPCRLTWGIMRSGGRLHLYNSDDVSRSLCGDATAPDLAATRPSTRCRACLGMAPDAQRTSHIKIENVRWVSSRKPAQLGHALVDGSASRTACGTHLIGTYDIDRAIRLCTVCTELTAAPLARAVTYEWLPGKKTNHLHANHDRIAVCLAVADFNSGPFETRCVNCQRWAAKRGIEVAGA